MDVKRNDFVLQELLELAGKVVADVGCGDGRLVRLMAGLGARVTGVETGADRLAAARAAEPVADEGYLEGRAEALPFADRSLDGVVMVNSLHHVPVAQQARALAEAARVVRPGGFVYVCEPVADGPHFELMRPVHDETDVRAAAYAAVKDAARAGLAEVREVFYVNPVPYRDFDAFRARITGINPAIGGGFAAGEAELRAAFDRLGRPGPDGCTFDQPNRVNLLERRAG